MCTTRRIRGRHRPGGRLQRCGQRRQIQVLSLQWVTCEPKALTLPGFIGGQHALFLAMKAEGDHRGRCHGRRRGVRLRRRSAALPTSLPSSRRGTCPPATRWCWRWARPSSRLARVPPAPSPPRRRGVPSALVPACASGFGPNGGGGGGGVSAIFHRGDAYGSDPSWQTGPGVGTPSAARQLPDVALSGSSAIPPTSSRSSGTAPGNRPGAPAPPRRSGRR